MKPPKQTTILCPKCNNLAEWNLHFQVYICIECGNFITRREGKVFL